jgi:hypothetical protein
MQDVGDSVLRGGTNVVATLPDSLRLSSWLMVIGDMQAIDNCETRMQSLGANKALPSYEINWSPFKPATERYIAM